MGVFPSPGKYTIRNYTLKFLVEEFHRVKDYQVVGGPDWFESERYDIVAKAEGNPGGVQMREMQTLLADRFHLKFHRETREMPVYALVVAKNGPKLQISKEEKYGLTIDGTMISGKKVPMLHFVGALSGQLQRHILDKTGLMGDYDFAVKWVGPEAGAPDPGELLPRNATGPSIFTALQEQMGLRLEATKGPVEVLVIDHAEKPTEN